MTFTSHGHHIVGTTMELLPTDHPIAKCGGPALCTQCAHEAAQARNEIPKNLDEKLGLELTVFEGMDTQEYAKLLVSQYHNSKTVAPLFITTDDVFVVWFCKTLQNWKCLLGTNTPDQMYYEVTHNGDKDETYLDAYSKVENVCIPDHKEKT